MTILFYVMIAMVIGLAVAAIFLGHLIDGNLKQRNLNIKIAAELHRIELSLQTAKTAMTGLANKQKNIGVFGDVGLDNFHADQLSSPAMLSTILTVLVYKYKTLRITIDDFMAVPDDEYISVYVDSVKKDLILSSDHGLANEDPATLINYTNSNDDTFH